MRHDSFRHLRFCRTCGARDRHIVHGRCVVCHQHPDVEPVDRDTRDDYEGTEA